MPNVTRFLEAQNNQHYETAKNEMDQGHKTSHWIWYIFPQIKGIGFSALAKKYAIENLNEACAYLDHPILFERYSDILLSVQTKLEQNIPVETLMGSEIDAQKLVSSLTLFESAAQSMRVAQSDKFDRLATLCTRILSLLAQQGYSKCYQTLTQLQSKDAQALYHPAALFQRSPPTATKKPQRSDVPPQQTVKDHEPHNPNMCQRINTVLINYITLRAQEPSHWYQGMFMGYSKQEKLRSALSLYCLLNGKEECDRQWGDIMKTYSFPGDAFTQWNRTSVLPVLRQGRLGRELRKIAKSSDGKIPSSIPLLSPPNTVRAMIEYIELQQSQRPARKFHRMGV